MAGRGRSGWVCMGDGEDVIQVPDEETGLMISDSGQSWLVCF